MSRKKQILQTLCLIIILVGLCFGTAVTHDPWDGTGWNTSAPNDEALAGNTYKELYDLRKGVELRINREHVTLASSSAGGWHLNGSAVCYEGTTAEPNLPDDSAALSNIARDRGRLWLDDNFDPPVLKRWTGAAYEVVGTIGSGSAPKAYLISDANEDTDGGRESKIIFKGEKDDDTSHELGMVQVSHDGTGDDYKADIIISLNDGNDADGSLTEVVRIDSAKLATLPGAVSITGDVAVNTNKFTVTAASGNTLVAGTLDVTGNIDPTTYETTNGGFLDEDNMASDAADKVASQQSVKAYVDSITDPAYSGGESHTFEGGLIMKMGSVSVSAGSTSTVTFGDGFSTIIMAFCGYATTSADSFAPYLTAKSTSAITIFNESAGTETIDWIAIGH